LLQEWQSSTESKSDFASRHGISQSTFYHWTRNLRRSSSIKQPRSGFRAISVEDPAIPASPVAVILYPSGIRLEFHELPDPGFVKALVH
jgi:transposase-like protein